MYISKLKVSGFHSLKDVEINFQPGLNVLVGKNNAGKSNIIRAIDYILSEKNPTYQDYDDRCFYNDGSAQVSELQIVAKVAGANINSGAIKVLSKKVKTWCSRTTPNLDQLRSWLHTITSGNSESPWPSLQEIINRLKQAEAIYLILLVPKGSDRDERNFGLVFKSNDWWHYCDYVGDLREALLTTAYIPSFRDPTNQFRSNRYSWYGKLVHAIYNHRTDEQKQKIAHAQTVQAEVLGDVFHAATADLRKRLSKAVFHHEITFQSGANTSDDEYKQIMMFVNDGINAPFYEKGSGIQSALVLGLFSFYCQQFHKGSSLLLVEEPEIYLHPQARRAIESQLVQFVNEGMTQDDPPQYNHQVIISTHSPEFLRSVRTESLSLVRKESGQTASTVRQVDSSTSRARQIIETKNAEMFFADHVILVEGGEEYILPPLANVVLGESEEMSWLDVQNISVARVNGKGWFKSYADLLSDFGIGWMILTDLDFLCDGIGQFSNLLDIETRNAHSRVMQQWNYLKGQNTPQGKKIKERVFSSESLDWKQLYGEVDQAIEELSSGNVPHSGRLLALRDLWDTLKQRVSRDIDYQELHRLVGSDLQVVLDALKQHNIYVLPMGELEDHLPDEALISASDQSKDRRALCFGSAIAVRPLEQWVSDWVSSEKAAPFRELLKHVQTEILGQDKGVLEIPSVQGEDLPF